MNAVILAFDVALAALRTVFFVLALVAAAVAAVDWLVRTRRINPFNPVARFFRTAVDPLLAPIERRVIRAGGLPTSAPWWALVAVVIGGIVIISLLGFLRGQLVAATFALGAGPTGILVLVVRWTFAILKIALIVRVVSSLLRVSPYSRWVRWSYRLSDPILRPLQRLIPPVGMIDLSPIAAYVLLVVLEWLLLNLVAGV